ncbi:MAG TPA: lysoplasmalogenase [Leptospiraceae bacterium]|nr:lysoplasmalogenase [Leptospiraceae bacterium]HMY66747.1 lysoplasmalogenase [Leptospiraceae bacterium]HNF13851.1 lysoplasmalogenase [Leptospiraceae bacterium]HNF23212.1 lysoplasmalogenase [Leptospiraceae bacterium]HNH06927.1 lysoplasmalogenase [Leptospiraceae bacterium]
MMKYLFFGTCILHLLASGFFREYFGLSLLTKMIPMAVLLYSVLEKGLSTKERKYFFIGLLFSSAGDALLAYENLFVFGLSSFLTAHLFYITGFSGSSGLHIFRSLPFYISGAALGAYIIPIVPENLRIPVSVYMMVLMSMGWRAASRNANWISLKYSLIGAFIFILSDTLIAFSKFLHMPMPPFPHFWVMVTYYTGQYLLWKGVDSV